MPEEFNIHELNVFDVAIVEYVLSTLIRHEARIPRDGKWDRDTFTRKDMLIFNLVEAISKTGRLVADDVSAQLKIVSADVRSAIYKGILDDHATSLSVLHRIHAIYLDNLNNPSVKTKNAVNIVSDLFRVFLEFKLEETRFVTCKASYGAMPNSAMEIQYLLYMC